jgi:VPDSG-CTERM motif
MKTKWMITTAVAALVGFSATVHATLITGQIGFTGSDLQFTANSVTFISTGIVDPTGPTQPSGSWAPAAGAGPVTFNNITSFSPLTVNTPLWTFTIGTTVYSFALTSLTVDTDIPGTILALTGSGTATISGGVYTPTAATWSLTATSGGPVDFTFSSGNTAVPDGGTTAMLLGAGLSGLALLKRKLVA